MMTRTTTFAGLCLSLVVMAVAQLAWGGVEGSKHDFSHQDGSKGDLCGACHTPHRSQPPKAAPLWDPNADLTRTFGSVATPGSGTRVCLRCHDGTIAKPVFTRNESRRAASALPEPRASARATATTDLHRGARYVPGHGSSDHPVGVEYPQFDKGFHPVHAVVSGGSVRIPEGKVECTSCHDPHNQSGENRMLVTSNARSALCLTCHRK